MDYETFKIKYTLIFRRMLSYTPDQAGSGIFAQELAPEFEERLENEECI
jgi:hypothetical protein